MSNNIKPKAFISCSVRDEDKKFNLAVEKIVRKHGFEPCGTVGRYVNYAEPVPVSMKKEIEACDILVVAAPPRFKQTEISSSNTNISVPEMIYIESAMAYSNEKPVVAFIQEGVSPGNFISSITQYFTVDSTTLKVKEKKQLKPFFTDLHNKVSETIKENKKETALVLVIFGFVVIGICTAANWVYKQFKPKE
ncbi:hypothetical protein EO244_00555 [Ancylomarina salipaludis]|uniref:CD-NTase-associated protein 12/Pycsar effector protein TIR domain-containing protein n=1 Tax=Ancylomarina salipaludis TaxID=2501299 RepID=A0A4Q1JPU2_9BACT|nr:hypothetical protein [Ancylomarina salipaludis]RXQ97412.1 hypothetical protein EO244_00555 [Ancylomarina salipaludis]